MTAFAPAATISIVVAIDPMTAFAVFTEDIGRWYRIDDPRFVHDPSRAIGLRFEPGVGGRLLEIYDADATEYHEYGRVIVWEPGKRLAFEWRLESFEPDQVTRVEVEFEAVEAGTRVALQHRGWDRLPPDHPARHGLSEAVDSRLRAVWWAEHLSEFKARAEHRAAR